MCKKRLAYARETKEGGETAFAKPPHGQWPLRLKLMRAGTSGGSPPKKGSHANNINVVPTQKRKEVSKYN